LMIKQPSDWWLRELNNKGVPCGPINTLDQVFDDPQVQHRQMVVELDHPNAGKVPSVANPVKFSETPVQYGAASPELGQHTDEVLQQLLNLSAEQIEQLKQQSVVA